jgi:hypothetical protein
VSNPIFPAFIKLEAKGTDEGKAAFLKAVNETMDAGERRTSEFADEAQRHVVAALSIRPETKSTFTAELDRALAPARANLQDFATSAQRNLNSALSGKVTATGGIDVDVAGARQAATVAEQRAAVARQLAQATQAAALAERDFSQATRLSIAAAKELADAETRAAATAKAQADQAERLQAELNRTGAAMRGLVAQNDNLATKSGAARQGMLQLGYQIGDAATMFSLGSNASQIFASQLGQTVQAVQLMTGGTSRLAAFLGGPWGIALSTAAIVTAPFIGKLYEIVTGANAATGALQKLIEKQRQQQAEKNTVPNAQKDLKALEKRRDELEAEIAKRGVRNPKTGELQFVYKQQQELKQVMKDLAEGRQALDNERAGSLSLDRMMGDLAAQRLKDAYATEKQTKAKVAKVKADNDEADAMERLVYAGMKAAQAFSEQTAKALGAGLDKDAAKYWDGVATRQAEALGKLTSTAEANADWNAQLAETVQLLEQIGGFGSALGEMGKIFAALSGGNLGSLPGAAGILGKAVGGVTWQTVDSDGNRMVHQLGDEFARVLDNVFGSKGSFSKVLESAGIGAAASQLAMGNKGSGLGSAIGGILGKEAGEALGKGVGGLLGKAAGPLGSIVGGVLGGALGGLLKSTKTGFAVISNRGVTSGGSSRELAQGAQNTGDSISAQLASIAERLGGSVGNYDVSIGTRSSGWIRVSASGSSRVADKNYNKGPDVIYNGKDPAEAARIALLNAIQDGAIKGIRAGAERLLKTGKDVEQALQKALDFEGVFSRLKAYRDPVGAALDTLDREFTRLQDIFAQAGASAAEYADLEALYGIERAKAVKAANDQILGSLRDLQKALTIGNDAMSLRDRNTAALAAYNPLAERVKAGDKTAYDDFVKASEDLLNIQRELYGSTGAYFSTQDAIKAITDKAITDQTLIDTASANRDSPFSDRTTAPTVDAIDRQTNALIEALESRLGTRLDALNDNTVALWRAQLAAASNSQAIPLPLRGYW